MLVKIEDPVAKKVPAFVIQLFPVFLFHGDVVGIAVYPVTRDRDHGVCELLGDLGLHGVQVDPGQMSQVRFVINFIHKIEIIAVHNVAIGLSRTEPLLKAVFQIGDMQALPVGVVLEQKPVVAQAVGIIQFFCNQRGDILSVQIGADKMVVFIRKVHHVPADLQIAAVLVIEHRPAAAVGVDPAQLAAVAAGADIIQAAVGFLEEGGAALHVNILKIRYPLILLLAGVKTEGDHLLLADVVIVETEQPVAHKEVISTQHVI